jgi:hypothetical protein
MMQSLKVEKKESQKQHNFPNRKRSKIYKNLVTFFSLFFLSVHAALVPRHNVVAGILKNVLTMKVGILFFKTLLLSLFPTLSRYLMGTQWVLQTFEKVIVVMLCKGRRGRGRG